MVLKSTDVSTVVEIFQALSIKTDKIQTQKEKLKTDRKFQNKSWNSKNLMQNSKYVY